MATAEQALTWVNKLYTRLSGRRPEIDELLRYLDGEQPLKYASEEWRKHHEDRFQGFSDNWCGVVARSPVDRLRIKGFRLGNPTDVRTADERQLWEDWNRNELTAQSNQGFLASVAAKRSAVLVWGDDNDEPVATWEHPSQVVVAYAQDGRRTRLAALKAWTEGDTEFATLYLPDEVWKFQRQCYSGSETGLYVPAAFLGGGQWKPREDLPTGEAWPFRNPLKRVPIVEWLNRPDLNGNPVSDISGTKAMQDAANLLWTYLFAAADYASMPARIVRGTPPMVPVLDGKGQKVGERPAKMEDLAGKRLLFLTNAEGIDQYDAARMDVFSREVGEIVGHIAAQTSTPGHYLLTNEKFANLNGDALTAAEVPLATKCRNQQTHFNPAAKETAALMAQVRGLDGMADAIRASDGERFVHWQDPAMHSLQQVADAATKDRAVGISLRTVLETRYGFTEDEIEREFQRVREESADSLIEGLLRPTPDEVGNADLGG